MVFVALNRALGLLQNSCIASVQTRTQEMEKGSILLPFGS